MDIHGVTQVLSCEQSQTRTMFFRCPSQKQLARDQENLESRLHFALTSNTSPELAREDAEDAFRSLHARRRTREERFGIDHDICMGACAGGRSVLQSTTQRPGNDRIHCGCRPGTPLESRQSCRTAAHHRNISNSQLEIDRGDGQESYAEVSGAHMLAHHPSSNRNVVHAGRVGSSDAPVGHVTLEMSPWSNLQYRSGASPASSKTSWESTNDNVDLEEETARVLAILQANPPEARRAFVRIQRQTDRRVRTARETLRRLGLQEC